MAPAQGHPRSASEELTPAVKVPKPRSERASAVSPLPRDMVWLSALHRSVAEGKTISAADRDLIRGRGGEPAGVAAIRYAELLVDIEVRIAEFTGGTVDERTRTRDELSLRREEAVETFRAACHARGVPPTDESPSEPVEAQVVRDIARSTFDKAFTRALRRRGLRDAALDPPTEGVWSWLYTHRGKPLPELAGEVKRLRKLDRAHFVREAVADVGRWNHDESLAHPAVMEQWAAATEDIVTELVVERRSAETAIRTGNGKSAIARLRRAGESYARGSARCLEAQLTVLEWRSRRPHRDGKTANGRVDALAEAVDAVRRADPALARQVDRAIKEHKRQCRNPGAKRSHVTCTATIVQAVRERLQPLDQPSPAGMPITAPPVDLPGPTTTPPVDTGCTEADAATDPSTVSACDHPRDTFLCPDLLKEIPTELARMVGVVSIAFTEERFGFAWISEHGELRIGADQAVNEHDAWLQALCHAALDLGGELSNVQIVCRDQRAASVATYVVDRQLVPEALGFPVSARTRDLLRALLKRRGKLFATGDDCAERHRGAGAAHRLAVAALAAGRGKGRAAHVKALADKVSEEFQRLAETTNVTTATAPRDAPDDRRPRWTLALGRAQIIGGWCPLPGPLNGMPAAGGRIALTVDHAGSERVESEVLIRQVGPRWELHGVVWPTALLPGTEMTLEWGSADGALTARTHLLHKPQRVDGDTYRHRYDLQVVVRENAPGSESTSKVPDLSDSGWVLRTLRKLGHLSPDGSAVLAEDALVRNCVELGLPPDRSERIRRAVHDLIRDRRITRVPGSLDHDGMPSYPPRRGQEPVDLLRYRPTVTSVTPEHDHRTSDRRSRRDHWVDGFVRRLPAGARASADMIQAHRDAVRAAAIVDRPLPDGFTYVRRHRRTR